MLLNQENLTFSRLLVSFYFLAWLTDNTRLKISDAEDQTRKNLRNKL